MESITGKPRTDKEFKNLLIYNILREKEEVSRADLTSITSINAVSISNYTNSFIKKKFIIEREIGASSGGRPPIMLALNNRHVFSAGIHISPTAILSSVLNASLGGSDRNEDPHAVGVKSDEIANRIISLMSNVDKTQLANLVISSENERINLEEVGSAIEAALNIDVFFSRPNISSAYAEAVLSDQYAGNNFIYSYKDIGDCCYIRNFDFITSEQKEESINHYLSPWDIDMGIISSARKMISQGIGTEMIELIGGNIENLTEQTVFAAGAKGDSLAVEILEFAGLNLGVRLAYLLNILKPEALILGGGVEKAGGHFINTVRKSIQKLALENVLKNVNIRYTSVDSKYAAAAGSAALGIRELFIRG